MKNLTLAVILTLALCANTVLADHPKGTIIVQVYGLVCDFCARALEKVFGKEAAVDEIHVDLDVKIVTIHLNEGYQLSDEVVSKHIEDSGYNIEDIRRGG